MRIDKLLASLDYGSRKDIKQLIKDGEITLNGKLVIRPEQDYQEGDLVTVCKEEVYYNSNLVLMLNKPKGYLSSNQDEGALSFNNLLEEKYRRLSLNVAGRLDLDASGILILTNNGDLIHRIISPKKGVNKTYLVTTEKQITKEQIRVLSHSIPLKDSKGEYYVANSKKVEQLDDFNLHLTIDEGKFHQVKNMVAYAGNEVKELKRIKIGSLALGDLKEGEYRELSMYEVSLLFKDENWRS